MKIVLAADGPLDPSATLARYHLWGEDPTIRIGERWLFGRVPYEQLAAAAVEAGARPLHPGSISIGDAFLRFDRLAPKEVELLCGLRGPLAHSELWQFVTQWKLQALPVGAGWLFERV